MVTDPVHAIYKLGAKIWAIMLVTRAEPVAILGYGSVTVGTAAYFLPQTPAKHSHSVRELKYIAVLATASAFRRARAAHSTEGLSHMVGTVHAARQ